MNFFVLFAIIGMLASLTTGFLFGKEYRVKFNLFLGFVAILSPTFYFTWWKALIYCIVMGILFYYMIRFEKAKEKYKHETDKFLEKL